MILHEVQILIIALVKNCMLKIHARPQSMTYIYTRNMCLNVRYDICNLNKEDKIEILIQFYFPYADRNVTPNEKR